MNNTLTIARREFRSYFNSPAAYIVGVLFLVVLSFLFWNAFFLEQRASLRQLFFWAFTLSAYNGGLGWISRDKNRASASGADPARWFGHVEAHSARAGWAFRENRTYVQRILLRLEPAYIAAGWPGEAVCP